MVKYINPLKEYSDNKAKEFQTGIEKNGVDYLIKMNEEVNAVVKSKGLKSKDYKKFMEEQADGNKDSGRE